MSPADIEALFAQNAAGFGGAPAAAPGDAAVTAATQAVSAPQPEAASASGGVAEPSPGPVPDSAVNRAAEDDGRSAPSEPLHSASDAVSEPEPDREPVPPSADAVLTDTAAARAEDIVPDEPVPGEADTATGVEADTANDAEAGPAAHTTIGDLFAEYGKYVALFVGAGLISGSVVHFPLAPVRYTIIGALGALIFAIASVVSELGDRDPLRLCRVAASSLALALGIGMISGSIQHFLDIPDRAALLIPLGVVLSLAAFGIRHGLRLKRTDLALIVPWLIIAVVALGFGLGKLADVAKAHGGGGGHGHESGATDGHGSDATAAHGATGKGADEGHGAAEADGHGSDAEATAAEDDGHADEGAHASDDAHAEEGAHASDDAHAEERAHASDDAHAEEDAHASDDAHAEEDAHASGDAHADEDPHAGEDAAVEASNDDGKSALHAKDSHRDRLRLVP